VLKLLRIRGKVLNGYKDRFERVASGAIELKRGGAKQLMAAKMGRRHKEHPLTRNLRPGHLVDGIIKLASINKDNHDTRSSYALTFELKKGVYDGLKSCEMILWKKLSRETPV
jgi:hypothetical protein